MGHTISIAPFSAAFLELFVNVGRYLQAGGVKVEYLNPDKFIASELKQRGLKTVFYAVTPDIQTFYDASKELITYHSRLYRIKNQQRFIGIKNREYSKCHAYLSENGAQKTVLFWNGSGTVEKDVVEQLGISAYYLENGYFPNTLQVNRGGVNCNADFASLSRSQFLSAAQNVVAFSPKGFVFEPVKPNPLRRMLLRLFDSNFNFMVQEALLHNLLENKAKKRFAALAADQFDLLSAGDYIFFPLQVNSDTQIVLNSPYSSMYEAVETVLPELQKTGRKVIFKEHPFEVEPVDYSRFIDNKQTFLLRKFDLNALMDNACLTVNINSSVGLQAIERGGKVLLLGKSMYSHAPNCSSYSGYASITALLESDLESQSVVDTYISHFKESVFLKGNWRAIDEPLLQQIAQRVTAAH